MDISNLNALVASMGVVALAEVGDKTQLLSLLLATRFKRPWPIVFGIFVATLANHGFAAAIGAWVTQVLSVNTMGLVLGVSFLLMGLWMLVPDKLDGGDLNTRGLGVFGTTLIAFFLAEMGDKTQVATIALAAQYHALALVVIGTTLGMMIANVPIVFLGEKIVRHLPVRAVHAVAAVLFAGLGVYALVNTEINLELRSVSRWLCDLNATQSFIQSAGACE